MRYRAVPSPVLQEVFPAGVVSYAVILLVPCRKCEACKAVRAHFWAHRAEREFERAATTWLGTITLNPFHRQMVIAKSATWFHIHPDAKATVANEFRARCWAMGIEVTKYLKRVRANERQRSGLLKPLRYLLVAEEHADGFPHFHLLLHEARQFDFVHDEEYYLTKNGSVRVDDKALLKTAWSFGYTQYKRADLIAATYPCKYLSKDMLWRVRASLRYGQDLILTKGKTGDCGKEPALKGTGAAARPSGLPLKEVPCLTRLRGPGGPSNAI